MAKSAIVILNWNGISLLKRFLGKVVETAAVEKVPVYVADNGSDDGSPEYIRENHKEVILIMLERNYGFALGYNIALEQIEAQYYILLNSDIEVTDGWIRPLTAFMDWNPTVAVCQPKILSWHQRDQFEYAGAAGGYIDWLGYPLCRGRILTNLEKDNGQYDDPVDVFWASGACNIIRSDAWKKCRGFDPDFFAHMEEIDLCWRFHRSGYRVSYIPDSVVYHVGGGVLPYNSPFKTYLNFRNSLFLLYKNLPDESLNRVMLIRRFLDGLAALFFLFKGQFRSVRSVWRAHMDLYKDFEKTKEKRETLKRNCNEKVTDMILNKSLIFEFYIKRNKTFSSLTTYFDRK
jgi:GT2 family glycosyltransferase